MKNISEECPLCGHDLIITKAPCGISITGQLKMTSSLCSDLNREQMDYLLTFIHCECKFNRMEEELKSSCPTIKNRFYKILGTMGVELDNHLLFNPLTKNERMEIL